MNKNLAKFSFLALVVALLSLCTLSLIALGPPSAKTLSATNITSTGATLNATMSANGLDTKGRFESCDPESSPSYFKASPWLDIKGTEPVTVSHVLNGLTSNTAYNYRAYVNNTAGFRWGNCVAFKTLEAGEQPSATTQEPESKAGLDLMALLLLLSTIALLGRRK